MTQTLEIIKWNCQTSEISESLTFAEFFSAAEPILNKFVAQTSFLEQYDDLLKEKKMTLLSF